MTKILVVDDSPIDRRLAGGLLEKAGLKVAYAADGAQAIDAIKMSPCDLVLTDMQMPDVNGLELVQKLHADFPHVPVILMTARGSEEIAVKALHEGAAGYVPKRSLGTELASVVRNVLSRADETRSLGAIMSRLERRQEIFHLENDVALLMSLTRHLQQSVADVWDLPRSERLRIGTALEEGILNALYHGNLEVSSKLKETDHAEFYRVAEARTRESPYLDRRIHVTLEMEPREVRFIIRDEGKGFDPKALPDPTDLANLDRPSGRGVLLMRAFMDEVSYNDHGNEVTLVKRCPKDRSPRA